MIKILTIDDNEINLSLIVEILRKHPSATKVFKAISGTDGINIAKREIPDLILLDILMPNLDGFDVCKILKNNDLTQHIPIIMVSALGNNTKDRIKSLDVGADAIIAKPFDRNELISQINVMLRIKLAEDELRKQNKIQSELVKDLNKNLLKINKYQKKLKLLNSRIIAIEENERRKVAEYLHDGISQTLSIAQINLSSLSNKNLSKQEHNLIANTIGLINDSIIKARVLTLDLSPPILFELGLLEAITWKLDDIKQNYNIETKYKTTIDNVKFSMETRAFIFRIISELFNNIIKHAKASIIEVLFDINNIFYNFTVIDNGVGFAFNNKSILSGGGGFGLFSIRERIDNLGGKFIIKSKPGYGTKICISLPKNIK